MNKGLEVSDWQPIDTAPKDGTLILGYEDLGGGVYRETKWEERRWVWYEIIDGYDAEWNPSHWVPMPPPPA